MNATPYRVVWKPSVIEIQLARIVANLFDRNESIAPVNEAMERIERDLARDPNNRTTSANLVLIANAFTRTVDSRSGLPFTMTNGSFMYSRLGIPFRNTFADSEPRLIPPCHG